MMQRIFIATVLLLFVSPYLYRSAECADDKGDPLHHGPSLGFETEISPKTVTPASTAPTRGTYGDTIPRERPTLLGNNVSFLAARADVSPHKKGKEDSRSFSKKISALVREQKLDDALQLITEQIEAVSHEDPDFFYLNLYAGEFLIQKRNHMILDELGGYYTQGGMEAQKVFGKKFARHLSVHEKPNKEALRFLHKAWNSLYLVTENDYDMAVPRLTDAFYALVKPYISYTLFEVNSAKILEAWQPVLSAGCTLLKQIPVGKVYLEGHTDDRGSEDENLALSKKRATSVKKYLVDHGISDRLITADGKGEMYPIASNDTREGRARNRRVNMVLSIRFSTH